MEQNKNQNERTKKMHITININFIDSYYCYYSYMACDC
jgi:hypothetical protein